MARRSARGPHRILHVPFYRTMCWYCGCHTTASRRDGPIVSYLSAISQEIELIAPRASAAGWRSITCTSEAARLRSLSRRILLRLLDRFRASWACSPDPFVLHRHRLNAWRSGPIGCRCSVMPTWRLKKHQRKIGEASLPDAGARYEQAESIGAALVAAGYRRIALDRYTLPADAMAVAQDRGRFGATSRANTIDRSDVLPAFGPSGIGRLPQATSRTRWSWAGTPSGAERRTHSRAV